MVIFPDDRTPKAKHPPWCDKSRCHVGRGYLRHDGHRSEPLTLGRVTLTLSQRHGESDVTLEVRARATLTADEAATWRTAAWRAAVAVDHALRESASVSHPWQNDHSEHTAPTAPGGDRQW